MPKKTQLVPKKILVSTRSGKKFYRTYHVKPASKVASSLTPTPNKNGKTLAETEKELAELKQKEEELLKLRDKLLKETTKTIIQPEKVHGSKPKYVTTEDDYDFYVSAEDEGIAYAAVHGGYEVSNPKVHRAAAEVRKVHKNLNVELYRFVASEKFGELVEERGDVHLSDPRILVDVDNNVNPGGRKIEKVTFGDYWFVENVQENGLDYAVMHSGYGSEVDDSTLKKSIRKYREAVNVLEKLVGEVLSSGEIEQYAET